ncbi:hypothetical protein HYC85_020339 [Camellia sinensis]|uniref:HTH myb-type domain-containing protein n=1 Tax=Camellia sinensis TaxID=4442 RepID=A0A7J7GQF6_CAMSI|nr:hypothetical protein HYC85_020339 [Camellia sinensis]
MDFISGLPKINGMHSIMVVVDRFSKYVVFIHAPHACPVDIAADLFYNYVVKYFGLLEDIIQGYLDDDSDLDYELEVLPPVSSEASTEAAACVLIASGLQSDTSLSNGLTVEAPLTINIPNAQSSRGPLENSQLQGTNVTIPVSVQKQPLPMVMSEVLDANGSASGNLPPRRKRKPWSAAEDLELIAAVQKCGEGNWANILKGDFKHDRTASQLSQRWTIIRKRRSNVNVGGGSQLSEAQLAARRAVSLALNMPMVDSLTAACSNAAATNLNTAPSNPTRPVAVEASSVGTQSQHLSRQDSIPTTSKSRVTIKRPLTKPTLSPDDMVKAAAVAAGARIATPSDAASLLKAAQAKNAVHIIPGSGSLIKSPSAASTNSLPPNVHFIRTGLTATPTSTYPTFSTNASRPGGAQQSQNNSSKPATELNPSAVVTNAIITSSLVASELKAFDALNSLSCNPPKEHVKEGQDGVLCNAAREQVQEARAIVSGDALEEKVNDKYLKKEKVNEVHQASVSGNAPKGQVQDQTALPSSETILKGQSDLVENLKCSSNSKITRDCQTGIISEDPTSGSDKGEDDMMIAMPIDEGREIQAAVEKTCENQRLDAQQSVMKED